ncbi:hypothetical protein JCM10213_000395 [Rhodosporidiobolus nylandii]
MAPSAPSAIAQPHTLGKTSAVTRSRIPSASSLVPDKGAKTTDASTRLTPSALPARTRTRTQSQSVKEDALTPAYASLTGLAVEVQAPSSDPAVELAVEGQQAQEKEQVQMPTPPGSASPPKPKAARASLAGKKTLPNPVPPPSRLPRTRTTATSSTSTIPASTSSSSLAPPAKPRRSSRSPSASAQAAEIPAGPSHAPHVLAARRRSSVSPLPPTHSSHTASTSRSSLASRTSLSAPAPPGVPVITLPPPVLPRPNRGAKARKLRARPSETLPAPIELSSDESEDDPLLLLGPEQTRGRGEGRPMGARRGTPVPAKGVLRRESKVVRREESVKDESLELEDAPAAQKEDEAMRDEELPQHEQREEEYGGGYDGGESYYAAEEEQGMQYGEMELPVPPAMNAAADPSTSFSTSSFSSSHAGPAAPHPSARSSGPAAPHPSARSPPAPALQPHEQDRYEQDEREQADERDSFVALRDASSGSDGEGEDEPEEPGFGPEQPAQLEELKQQDAHLEEPSEEKIDVGQQQDKQQDPVGHAGEEEVQRPAPAALHHSPSPSRSPSLAPTDPASPTSAYDEEPSIHIPFPLQPHRLARPSYPPLSAEESGEWDAVVAVEMGSSPVRGDSFPPRDEQVEVDGEERVFEEEGSEVEEPEFQLEADGTMVMEQEEQPPIADPADGGERLLSPKEESQDQLAPPPPSMGHRSHSPAVPSPFFHRSSAAAPARSGSPFRRPSRVPATASPAPQVHQHPHPNRSTPIAGRPSLAFASPRPPRERYPSLALPSPAPEAIPRATSPQPAATESTSTRTWTRGPAFFRSSSFTPPPHAEIPRSATLFTRRPGRSPSAAFGADEQSRDDYHRFDDLTPTSPFAEEIQKVREEVRDTEDGEGRGEEDEEQVVLVGQEKQALARARSLSASPPRQVGQQEGEDLPPATPEKDDVRMTSPAASLRSHRLESRATPPHSPNGENMVMSSPSPSESGSPVHSRASSAASELQLDKRLPPTPSAAGAHEADADSRMASPSPLKKSAQVVGGLVESGREKLQGLLFGQREPKRATWEEKGKSRAADEQDEQDEDNLDAPFANQRSQQNNVLTASTSGPAPPHPFPPSVAAESTFSSTSTSQDLSVFSTASSSASQSRRRRSSRHSRRPSHPSLPVIEISSTDAKAAARAAAILKCYHDYIEQGVEAVEALQAAKESAEDGEDDEDEELRTLLLDAEDEVRAMLPPPRPKRARDAVRRSDESSAGDVSGSTASAGAPTPPRPSAAPAAAAGARNHSRSASGSNLTTSANLSTWTSSDWRRLEHALVECGRRYRRGESVSSVGTENLSVVSSMSAVGEEVDGEVVLEAFLRKVGVSKEELQGQWEWDTLLLRVNALKVRRAKDVRLRRASSLSSNLSTATSLYSKAPLPPRQQQQSKQVKPTQPRQPETLDEELRRASSPAAEEEAERQHEGEPRSPDASGSDEEDKHVEVKQEQLSEHGGHAEGGDITSSDSEDDEEQSRRRAADDTFFHSAGTRRDRRMRRSSVQPVYRPVPLANPALRHLYEEAPPPVKPRVPDFVRQQSPVVEEEQEEGDVTASVDEQEDDEQVRSRDVATPEQEQREPSQPPSSAQRLFSWAGSLLRRSPAPEPSPSSTRVVAPISASTSPEPESIGQRESLSPVHEEGPVDMQESSLRRAVVTPKPVPHPADRKIRPLPPPHFPSLAQTTPEAPQPIASSSRHTDEADPAASSSTPRLQPQPHRRIRRRSSGEGRVWELVDAIEEAESSREEEEARISELLQSGGAKKRRAGAGDLRSRTAGEVGEDVDRNWRAFVEIDRSIVHSGVRATDRRPSGETRPSMR